MCVLLSVVQSQEFLPVSSMLVIALPSPHPQTLCCMRMQLQSRRRELTALSMACQLDCTRNSSGWWFAPLVGDLSPWLVICPPGWWFVPLVGHLIQPVSYVLLCHSELSLLHFIFTHGCLACYPSPSPCPNSSLPPFLPPALPPSRLTFLPFLLLSHFPLITSLFSLPPPSFFSPYQTRWLCAILGV